MTKIRHPQNYALGAAPKDVEIPYGVSVTVPDQSMSLKELLQRHTRGLPVPQRQPYYSEQEFPELEKLDLVQIDELKQANKANISQLRHNLQKPKPAQGDKDPKEPAEPIEQKPSKKTEALEPPKTE